MTPNEARAMEPGRDMDARIAEVFGWTHMKSPHFTDPDYHPWYGWPPDADALRPFPSRPVPHYSTDPAHLATLLDWLAAHLPTAEEAQASSGLPFSGDAPTVLNIYRGSTGVWWVSSRGYVGSSVCAIWSASSPTLLHSAARAVLVFAAERQALQTKQEPA